MGFIFPFHTLIYPYFLNTIQKRSSQGTEQLTPLCTSKVNVSLSRPPPPRPATWLASVSVTTVTTRHSMLNGSQQGGGAPLFDFYCGPLPSGSGGGERTDLWFTLGRPPRMSAAGSIDTRPGYLVLCRVWPGPGAKRAPRARGQAHRHSQTLGSEAAVYLGGLMLFLQIF